MRRIAVLFALLLALTALASTALAQSPRQVRVRLDANVTLRTLLEAGLDIVDVHGGDVDLFEWPGDAATLAMHYDGVAWSIVPAPNPIGPGGCGHGDRG